MRYRIDWNCKAWKDFSAKDEIDPVPTYEWWTEYQKYHCSFDSCSPFLQRVQDIVKTMLPKQADVTMALAALPLLVNGKISKLRIDDLELVAMEVEE